MYWEVCNVNDAPNLAMLLPRPFRRGEGRGEGSIRVVYHTSSSVKRRGGKNCLPQPTD